MSTILSASAPTTFEIKSANLPLVALLLKSPDLEQLTEELKQRFGDIPDFFDNDPLVIDLRPMQADDQVADQSVDFAALVALLEGFRLRPIAVKGGNESQTAAAVALGLLASDDVRVHTPRIQEPEPAPQTPAPAAPDPEPEMAVDVPETPQGAMVIDKPLRSGQQVYARGRDLVVMAMVNPGAEIIADGHIHVYAPLRGRAIAGARGDTDARIFALTMSPELISIAGIYRTSETPLPDDVQGKTAQVRLECNDSGDHLVIQPLNP
ncbi:septum site-determining protein MinC [Hydrogenophaga sp. 5NK40-0174]|uniref:septum site-determining protein MinC n=1 Tax=Hydrogenophaga sp. 5NK40-0174 TaxID=3127649 RepID=UPI0031033AF7